MQRTFARAVVERQFVVAAVAGKAVEADAGQTEGLIAAVA